MRWREVVELALDALEEAEWADNSGGEYRLACPVCGTTINYARTHSPDCLLVRALEACRRALGQG